MQIVITGASTGIGLASVKRCLAAGHRVLATARTTGDLASLRALGAEVVTLELCDQSSIDESTAQIAAWCNGSIDVLFNNAGYGLQVAMEDATPRALAEQLQTNVLGPISFTNTLLPCLQPGSRLVFNSSILGVAVLPFRGPYCMSKFALEAAADAYRLELEGRGVDVTVIQPGPIQANFRRNAYAALQRCLQGKSTRLDYTQHAQRLQAEELPGRMPSEGVAELFLAIAEGRKTKPRYLVTRSAILAAWMKRLLGSGFHHIAKRTETLQERH